jgi:hypothetical protein
MIQVHYLLKLGVWMILSSVLSLIGNQAFAQVPAGNNTPSVTNKAALIASIGPDTPFASAILEHQGGKLPEQGPWTVSTNDLMQISSFIADLVEHKDPMFAFLGNLLTSETRTALEAERGKMGIFGVPYKAGKGLLDLTTNLNKLIEGKLIYDEAAFAKYKPYLSGDTVKLLNQPAGADVARLNRLLLEDIFLLDITRRPKILFDTNAQNYVFIDFAKKTVSLYDKDGEKKWTADLGPSIAGEIREFPYIRNPGTPSSRNNTGLWDVTIEHWNARPQPGMIFIRLTADHYYRITISNGKLTRLPHP